uniref:Fc receptor, IgE, high affinity I, gamma polypeptide like n=1 Tax=Mastacembelus armatus TaxID=205130 RepID=A0A3Q3LF25_9TELE
MNMPALCCLLLMMCFLCAEAFGDMFVCYILDGILILYGIILTVLYCRLKVRHTHTHTHTHTPRFSTSVLSHNTHNSVSVPTSC